MELKTTTTTTKTLLKYVVFWGKEKAQFRKKKGKFQDKTREESLFPRSCFPDSVKGNMP